MKNTIRKGLSLLFVLGAVLFPANFISASQDINPIIETKSYPNGSSITVTLPEGYSGKVLTSCYNGVCTSTSSQITKKEIDDISERIKKQQVEMEKFFNEQQKMLNEMFNSVWSWSW